MRRLFLEERCLKYFRCLEEFSVVKISKDDEVIITDKFHCCSTNIAIVILVPGFAAQSLLGQSKDGGLGSTEHALSAVVYQVEM